MSQPPSSSIFRDRKLLSFSLPSVLTDVAHRDGVTRYALAPASTDSRALNQATPVFAPTAMLSATLNQLPTNKADDNIPDESDVAKALFMQIIDDGLTSIFPRMRKATVVVVGGGPSGLCAAWELKRAGIDVMVLEASHRVGGRVITFHEPFAAGLHGEGGAMRLPKAHFLVEAYLGTMNMLDQLEPFEQRNKVIHLSAYDNDPSNCTMTYDEFNTKLQAREAKLLMLFPGMKDEEKGKTIDQLWEIAVAPVFQMFNEALKKTQSITRAYSTVVAFYDKYSLRTYLEQIAGWSQSVIQLYDLASAHVVFENGFIESWKDAFLSSNSQGQDAEMKQLKGGMDTLPLAFVDPKRAIQPGCQSLHENIRYGSRVTHMEQQVNKQVVLNYQCMGKEVSITADYVIVTIPYTSLRSVKTQPHFSVAKMGAIRELRYVEVTKVLLQFRTRWWEQWLNARGQNTEGGLVTDLPIRYAMFPPAASAQFAGNQKRGVIMASYCFEQDATELGGMSEENRQCEVVANLATIFGPLVEDQIEVGCSQVWPAAELAGGSAFAYFGPMQKSRLFEDILSDDWDHRVHFGGEHASYTHGWIQGAFEAGLRCAYEVCEQLLVVQEGGQMNHQAPKMETSSSKKKQKVSK